ncbi:murein DD-endopeptidase MepM [bacterium BMS3Bbin12]|nr:murein DD-endopeptidase MepM [bacterium BMS3Abin12]GBE47374.1 murein DD-endopeptidase MepM [bacterium BMS3Bbin12]GBE50320.1 murein DD-endopeptidase MepM [bacterium BMS3Bbin13]HDJ85678.1 peptidase M23 [Chromatiales bacterium]
MNPVDYRTLIGRDANPRGRSGGPGRRRAPRIRWWPASLAAALLASPFLSPAHDAAAPRRIVAPVPVAAAPRAPTPAETPPPASAPSTREVEVRRGDSLAAIFHRVGMSPQQLYEILHLNRDTARLRRIHPGQRLVFVIDDAGRLQSMEYRIRPTRRLLIRRGPKGLDSRVIDRRPEVRVGYAAAVIRDSLFVAGQRAGLPDNLIMELAHIFGWDIDFALDIRPGDRFTVVYERHYLDGTHLDEGNIVAAEFINRGRVYRALRYTDPRGRTDYYSPDGRSMRKAFLRTPVSFTRISSRFTLHRRHPILHRDRRHVGVDYAAPAGTPVHAAGDARVVFVGRKGGYGRTVILGHGDGYSTLYAHLSRFARGLRRGARVRQGRVIGYVGRSGLATGPHLHYEFRIRGVHRDPLRVHLPAARPIAARYRHDFRRSARALLAQLDVLGRSQVAMGE